MRLLVSLRSFLAFFLLLLPTAFAHAGITEAKNWIVDARAHKFLKTLAENIGTDDTELAKGHAVATLSISGCNLSVLVVGPIAGDAKAYARAIDAWRAREGFTGDVQWSQEDDGAAAKYAYRPGHVGMSSATTTVDLPALREALLKVEPHTQFAVADAVWSKTDLGFAPDATSAQGTRYWNLTAPRPGLHPIVGTIRLPAWMPWLMLAWFLIPIVGVLGSFAAGIVIAKNARLPLAQRRRFYGKAVQGGTFGALGLHAVLFLATVPTRLFDPLAQLWFGERFTQIAILVVPAFVVFPMLALPFVNRVEKRLMGPSDEERLARVPDVLHLRTLTIPKKKGLARFSLLFTALGLGIIGVGFFLPKTVHYRELLNPLGMMVAFLPGIFLRGKADLPKFAVEPETLRDLDSKLSERVSAMAARLGMDAPPSRVLTEAIYGRFGAVLDRKGVGVTVGAMEALTPGEIDFLVAHELAHGKLGHLKTRRRLMGGFFAACILPMVVLLALGKTALATPGFVFTPMLVPFVVMFPFGFAQRRMMRRQEFEADRLAVHATGDPETARLTLRKITLNSASPGVHDIDISAHPAVGARLAAL